VERIPRIALHHPSDEDLLLHPSEQRPLAGDPESAGDPGTLHPGLLSPPPSGTTCGGANCLRRDELRFIVSHISDSSCGPPPAHRDKTAMNGAQLLMAHNDSSGPMSGPPAGDPDSGAPCPWVTARRFAGFPAWYLRPCGLCSSLA